MEVLIVISFVLVILALIFECMSLGRIKYQDKKIKHHSRVLDSLVQPVESEFPTSAELQSMLNELQTMYASQGEALVQANTELAAQIKALVEEKQKGSIITVDSLAVALDANFNRMEALCTHFEETGKALESSYEKLSGFIKANKPTLEAINKLAGEFLKLRNELTTHTNTAETVAVEKICAIADSLESKVTDTWNNINDTLIRNSKELFGAYEHFFEACKAMPTTDNEALNG